MHTSDRGGRDWAADAASSTSERIERTERTEKIESGGGKKSKMQLKYLNVTSDDLWRIRDKVSGKKSSLAKTKKTNKEANDIRLEPAGVEVCGDLGTPVCKF